MPLGEYNVLVGFYDSQSRSGRRVRMLGKEDDNRRYSIGTLVVDGTRTGGVTNITGVRLVKPAQPPVIDRRTLPNPTYTDFGQARTKDAFRGIVSGNTVLLTPLPDGEDTTLTLRPDAVFGRPVRVKQVDVVDAQGKTVRPVKFEQVIGGLTLKIPKTDFGWRVTVE
jgi:hypothetical protein